MVFGRNDNYNGTGDPRLILLSFENPVRLKRMCNITLRCVWRLKWLRSATPCGICVGGEQVSVARSIDKFIRNRLVDFWRSRPDPIQCAGNNTNILRCVFTTAVTPFFKHVKFWNRFLRTCEDEQRRCFFCNNLFSAPTRFVSRNPPSAGECEVGTEPNKWVFLFFTKAEKFKRVFWTSVEYTRKWQHTLYSTVLFLFSSTTRETKNQINLLNKPLWMHNLTTSYIVAITWIQFE